MLEPGDSVTIESGQEFGPRRYRIGTVARVNGSYLTVCSEGPRGGKFVERYSLRDGFRIGRGTRAELVKAQPNEPASRDLLQRQTRQIDVLYRAWSRRRSELEGLRELRDAIDAYLRESLV